ncbi:hypothetical protein PGH12_11225 [Chryseobacterium wangxinyae]|uniref:hypothetical protein n=1 Tax=Chryseobacterium sp. CY350 TaxID=2997336 RepID=UPI002270BC40|nr:hypothetical protein [Chryseobacterium sp. CY350]MCY0976359.1 hypothetical protein [Chryseobacterium sp. CY350]WBZ94044.1 hypothetical protein PGH12_11225 [Chryseobacterium sp. CY350]
MDSVIKSLSSIFISFGDIWNVFFNDMDISDIEKKRILRDPEDRNTYLQKLEELRNSKESSIEVELKNHDSFTLYVEDTFSE